jgi:hypothetical protein
MSRRTVLSALLFAVLLGACGAHADPNATPSPTGGPSDSAGPSAPASAGNVVVTPFPSDPYGSAPVPLSPVAGVVTAVQPERPAAGSAASPAQVRGFTLMSTSGVTLTFVIGQMDNLADFPLSSLADHEDSQVPVLVWFKQQGADLVVYHLEDAP